MNSYKRFISFTLVSLLIFSLCSFTSFAADTSPNIEEPINYFRAAGFEEGMEEWAAGDGVTITQEEAHTGLSSLRVLRNEKFLSNIFGQNDIVLAAGQYEFSFYYKGENINETASLAYAFLFEEDQSEGVSDEITISNNSSGWTKITQGIELNEEQKITFILGVADCDVPIYLDDLCLTPSTTTLKNGGFENGLNNWTVVNPDGMMISDTNLQAKSGFSSLLIGGFQDEQINNGIQQTCLISGPGNYKLEAHVRAAYPFTGDGVMLLISYEDSQGNIVSNETFSGNDICDDWTLISCSLYIPAGTIRVHIGLTSYNSNCVFLIDDVELRQSDEIPFGNILGNNGFENNLKNWLVQGEENITTTILEKYSGNNAAQFSSSISEGLNKYIEQSYTVITGGTVEFSGYIKTADNMSGVGAVLFIEALDENNNLLSSVNSSAVSNTNHEWQKVSVSLTLPSGAKKVLVKIGGLYYQGSFYVDETNLHYI